MKTLLHSLNVRPVYKQSRYTTHTHKKRSIEEKFRANLLTVISGDQPMLLPCRDRSITLPLWMTRPDIAYLNL